MDQTYGYVLPSLHHCEQSIACTAASEVDNNIQPVGSNVADAPHTAPGFDTTNNTSTTPSESFFLDNIIVGYAFGPKKMETMGLIMAEASKALSTFECGGNLASILGSSRQQQQQVNQTQQQQQYQPHSKYYGNDYSTMDNMACDESSMATMTTNGASTAMLTDVEKESQASTQPTKRYFSDDEEDSRSLSSTQTRSSFISLRSRGSSQHQRGGMGGGGNNINGIQLTFLPDSSGFIHLVRTAGGGGGGGMNGGEGESITESSVTTSATTPLGSFRKQGTSSASCASVPLSLSSSFGRDVSENTQQQQCNSSRCSPVGRQQMTTQPSSLRSSNGSNTFSGNSAHRRRHPIRVSFVPIDLDTPLQEQHGGKFDVILHKMTEDILCMSKMLRARGQSCGEYDDRVIEDECCGQQQLARPNQDPNIFEATPSMTRHQTRASNRISRLREYKEKVHPSCVLVDSPNNILAVMSRADMAEVLSRCLAGVTTKGGIPVRTPRFRVVDEDSVLDATSSDSVTTPMMQQQKEQQQQRPTLADEIDNSGFEYPLIAKPLTAAGTKSSHHMGIVLARDGLQRLKTPCLLQEYANHGEKLFKVYVLGDSVWVFSRESLPNLPSGEKHMDNDAEHDSRQKDKHGVEGERLWSPQKRPRTESYVEFERPAGSRCYVEFNSQRPYPKLSDFGIAPEAAAVEDTNMHDDVPIYQPLPRSRIRPLDAPPSGQSHGNVERRISMPQNDNNCVNEDSDLARFVTKDEIEPVTTALRDAFGLEMFGFDVLVKHNNQGNKSALSSSGDDNNEGKEILVVDVNYFPGYKEVPHFPSLLAQYLTQKAVESRVRNFDGS